MTDGKSQTTEPERSIELLGNVATALNQQCARLEAELTIRKRQLGLMGNCLSHIQNSPIAPESIRVAATAAIVGASEMTKEIQHGE